MISDEEIEKLVYPDRRDKTLGMGIIMTSYFFLDKPAYEKYMSYLLSLISLHTPKSIDPSLFILNLMHALYWVFYVWGFIFIGIYFILEFAIRIAPKNPPTKELLIERDEAVAKLIRVQRFIFSRSISIVFIRIGIYFLSLKFQTW